MALARTCAAVTIDGTCKVGANFVIVALHPMKPGATLMSSFLFNVALVRLRQRGCVDDTSTHCA